MKIYALKDRLIDYFMQPFAAPDTKSVQQALARTVNNAQEATDIASAPHQFELWQLGYVTEDGHLTAEREYICDLSSLIRPGIRPAQLAKGPTATGAAENEQGAAGAGINGTPADSRPLPSEGRTAADAAAEVLRGNRRGYPPRGDS